MLVCQLLLLLSQFYEVGEACAPTSLMGPSAEILSIFLCCYLPTKVANASGVGYSKQLGSDVDV